MAPHPLLEARCICLGDFHAASDVRRARGYRHVFHRACLYRWVTHGHRTYPLCWAPSRLDLVAPHLLLCQASPTAQAPLWTALFLPRQGVVGPPHQATPPPAMAPPPSPDTQ